jgi:GNAT superfamily N-acetyltransferase
VTVPTFRPGGSADAASLARVAADAFATYADWNPPGWEPVDVETAMRPHLEDWLGTPDCWSSVCLADERAVGYIAIVPARTNGELRRPIPGVGQVWHLFVVREWWGTGVATRLLSDGMSYALRREYTEVRLWTPRDSPRARAFYEREGWSPSGAERYADDLRLNVVEYRRMLAS